MMMMMMMLMMMMTMMMEITIKIGRDNDAVCLHTRLNPAWILLLGWCWKGMILWKKAVLEGQVPGKRSRRRRRRWEDCISARLGYTTNEAGRSAQNRVLYRATVHTTTCWSGYETIQFRVMFTLTFVFCFCPLVPRWRIGPQLTRMEKMELVLFFVFVFLFFNNYGPSWLQFL